MVASFSDLRDHWLSTAVLEGRVPTVLGGQLGDARGQWGASLYCFPLPLRSSVPGICAGLPRPPSVSLVCGPQSTQWALLVCGHLQLTSLGF